MTKLDWPKYIAPQKELHGYDCFRTGDQSWIKCSKSVFTVREALRTASFCLVDCGTESSAAAESVCNVNLLCVTVHQGTCVGTFVCVCVCVCVPMFDSNCALWSDRLPFCTRAAVNLFHWIEPTGSQPHGHSHIQRFYTITHAHSPLAWFNRRPNDWKLHGNISTVFPTHSPLVLLHRWGLQPVWLNVTKQPFKKKKQVKTCRFFLTRADQHMESTYRCLEPWLWAPAAAAATDTELQPTHPSSVPQCDTGTLSGWAVVPKTVSSFQIKNKKHRSEFNLEIISFKSPTEAINKKNK